MTDTTHTAQDDLIESFQLAMRAIAANALEIRTLRTLLHSRGVTDQEYRRVRDALRTQRNEDAEALRTQIEEQREAERLDRLLASARGPKQ